MSHSSHDQDDWTFVHLHTTFQQFPNHASYPSLSQSTNNQSRFRSASTAPQNSTSNSSVSQTSTHFKPNTQSPRHPFTPLKNLIICLELCHKLSCLTHSQIQSKEYLSILRHLPLTHLVFAKTHVSDTLEDSAPLKLSHLLRKMERQWERTKELSLRWFVPARLQGKHQSTDSVQELPEFLKEHDGPQALMRSGSHESHLPRLAFGISEKEKLLYCAVELRGEFKLHDLDELRDYEGFLLNMDIFDEFLREGYHIVITGHGIAAVFATKLCLNLRRYAKERDTHSSSMGNTSYHDSQRIRYIGFGAPFIYDFSIDMEEYPVVEWEMEQLQKHADAFWTYYVELDLLPWILSYRTHTRTEDDFYAILDLIITNDSFNSSDANQRLKYLHLLKDVSTMDLIKLISTSSSRSSVTQLEYKVGVSKLMESVISQSKILLPNREPVGTCFMRQEVDTPRNHVVKLEPIESKSLREFNPVLKKHFETSTDPLLLLSHSSVNAYFEAFHEMIVQAYGRTIFQQEYSIQAAQRFLPEYTWVSSLHTPSPISPSLTNFELKMLANRLSYHVLRTPMDASNEKFEFKFTIHSSELEYVKSLEFEQRNQHTTTVLPAAQSNYRVVFVFVTDATVPLKVRLHTLFGESDWISIQQHEIVTRPMLKGKMLDYANLSLSELVLQATSFALIDDSAVDSGLLGGKQILSNRAETKVILYELEELWGTSLGNPFEHLSAKKRDLLIEDFKKYASNVRPFTSETRKRTNVLYKPETLHCLVPLSEIFMRHQSMESDERETVAHTLHLLDSSTAFAYSLQKQCASQMQKRKTTLEKTLVVTGLGTTALAFTTIGALGMATGFGAVISLPSFAIAAALGSFIGLGSIASTGHLISKWVMRFVKDYNQKLNFIAEAILNIDLTYVRAHTFFLEEVIVKRCASEKFLNLSDTEIIARWSEIFPDAHFEVSKRIREADKAQILKVLRSIQIIFNLRLHLAKISSCGIVSCGEKDILETIIHSLTHNSSSDYDLLDSIFPIGIKESYLHTFYLAECKDVSQAQQVKEKLDNLLVKNHRLVDCVCVVFRKVTQKECDLVESYRLPCLLASVEAPEKNLKTKHATVEHIDTDTLARIVSWVERSLHAFESR